MLVKLPRLTSFININNIQSITPQRKTVYVTGMDDASLAEEFFDTEAEAQQWAEEVAEIVNAKFREMQ